MLRARLGSLGPEISRVGFGSWATGGPYLFGWGPIDDQRSIDAMRHAIERGVNWVDTAPVYGLGHSEEVVGRALAPFRIGDEVYIFTKCGRTWDGPDPDAIGFDLRPETIRRECEDSLRRLGVERIDLLQFHWPDTETGTAIEDSWGVMATLIDEGKVRWGGVSNFDVGLLERCEAIRHIDSLQPPLNMLNRRALADVIPWCIEHGTGVIAYAPMANGLLAGRYTHAALDELAPDDWRRRTPAFNEPNLSRNLDLVERLRPIATRLQTSLPALAVGWALAQEGVTCAAIGARDPQQVDGWLGAGDLVLGAGERTAIARALEETGAGLS